MEEGTFAKSGLINIDLNESIIEIGPYTFKNCESLSSINIPNSVKKISEGAFEGCISLLSVVISNSISVLFSNTFYKCHSLTDVEIPNSITRIDNGVFDECISLKSIVIPSSVLQLDSRFINCINLEEIIVNEDNPNYCSFEGVLFDKEMKTLLRAPCIMQNYAVPESVATIGFSAFSNCSSLTSINIHDSVSTIENCAFYMCTALKTVKIPDLVSTINDAVFLGCSSLSSLSIPKSVNEIGFTAFNSCESLSTIYSFNQEPPTIGYGYAVFTGCPKNATIYIPKDSLEKYKISQGWSYFNDFREIDSDYVQQKETDNPDEHSIYYNLNGIKFYSAESLPSGLYIKHLHGKTTKIVIP